MVVSNPAPRRHWNARRLTGFVAGFGAVIVLAELLLRQIGWLQAEIGWMLLDRDVPAAAVQLVAALAGGLLTMAALMGLFAAAEWKVLRFSRFLPRYGAGLLYTATALVIAILIQTGAFMALGWLGFAPLLRAEELGPALVVLPFAYMIGIGFFEYWLHRALHGVPLLWRQEPMPHEKLTSTKEAAELLAADGSPTSLRWAKAAAPRRKERAAPLPNEEAAGAEAADAEAKRKAAKLAAMQARLDAFKKQQADAS